MSTRMVRQWIQNTCLYAMAQEAAQEAVNGSSDRDDATRKLEGVLEEMIRDEVGIDRASGLLHEMLYSVLDEVDFYDLADDFISQFDESEWVTMETCQECDSEFDPEYANDEEAKLCNPCHREAQEEKARAEAEWQEKLDTQEPWV